MKKAEFPFDQITLRTIILDSLDRYDEDTKFNYGELNLNNVNVRCIILPDWIPVGRYKITIEQA